MKILQLCIRVPYPTTDGGSIAMYEMQRSLTANGASLKVLSFNTVKQFVDLEKLDESYLKMTRIQGVYLDNRINAFAALFNLFTGESYHIIRFIRRDFEESLVDILKSENFDVIQLESLYMVPYLNVIRNHSNAKVVLRTHNIEHQIWQRLATISTNIFRKWYLNLLADRLKKYEQWSLNMVDAIVALTLQDEQLLREAGAEVPIFIAPVGIDAKEYPVQELPKEEVIFHIGAMDWLPNQEGMKWFLEKVWPTVIEKYPEVKLRFAGKKMPDEFYRYAGPQVEVSDFVEDAKQYMAEGSIMIVPLFSGSGMRVKIIEGMAMGKAIVTTPIGLEGIPAQNGKEVMVADSVAAFLNAIYRLIENPELKINLGKNARRLTEEIFDNHKIGGRVVHFYRDLVEKQVK